PSGRVTPLRAFTGILLPARSGPSSACTSPGSIESVAGRRATAGPSFFETSCTSSRLWRRSDSFDGKGRPEGAPFVASLRLYGPLQAKSCCFVYVVQGLICSRALYVGGRLGE